VVAYNNTPKCNTLKTTISKALLDEATRLLERWARRRQLLTKGKQLQITMFIKDSPLVSLKMEKHTSSSKLDRLLSQPIETLEFETRVAGCMNNACVKIIGDLTRKTEYEVRKFRNFGNKSLKEVEEKLQQHGLTLGMKNPVGPRERVLVLEGSIRPYCHWKVAQALEASGISNVNVFLSKTEDDIVPMLESYDANIQGRKQVYHSIHEVLRKRGLQQGEI
jgi:hypothetical protein